MANINAGAFTTRPEIDGTFGVCATTHWIATAVGMAMLEKGGNAFDAGIAAAFTLQVVEPHLCGPGGDVPVMVFDQRKGKPEVICGQGPAPAGATIKKYRDELGLDIIPGTGLLAPCIPGTFETFMLVLRDYGTMRLRDVLEPSIGYAKNGHPIVERACATISTVKDLFKQHWPTSAAVYLQGGKVPAAASLFRNPAHAETYLRILKEAEAGGGSREAEIDRARRAWSQGFVAEKIGEFCAKNEVMDVSGRRHKGVVNNPRAHKRIERFLENIPQLSVIGDFHSHTMWGYSRAASHPSDTDRQGMSPENVYVIVSMNDRLREVPWNYNDDGSLSGTTDEHHFRLTAYSVTAGHETRRMPILCPFAIGFDARPLRAVR